MTWTSLPRDFGPIAPVFVFDSDDEAIAHANNTIYGLAAYFIPKV